MNRNTAPLPLRTDRLLQRFLRYVRVETTANPDSLTYPSSVGQMELGRLLASELTAMGCDDVVQDEYGLVYATVPASVPHECPAVALIAHMDTSPEAAGGNVNPQVIEYAGGVIELSNGLTIDPLRVPELDDLAGKTLITTDGKTLLGGDDKCGVAIIMELAETLIENRHLPHGPLKIVMSCDEEIGHGTDHIDLQRLGAMVGYTIDGGGRGIIDVETFSADGISVEFVGHNVHPAIAKGRMINALRAASDFVSALPRDSMTPETTDGRLGFIHPYQIDGGVGSATVKMILRSFDESDLQEFADQVRQIAQRVAAGIEGLTTKVCVTRQYRNLAEGLQKLPQSIEFAETAFENLGQTPERMIVRGGTDGSQLTEKGLPTPNLSSGQYNIHSVTEFACLDDMAGALQHLIELSRLWASECV